MMENADVQALCGLLLFAVTGAICAFCLHHRDREAQRLADLGKRWGQKEDLQRVKRRLV